MKFAVTGGAGFVGSSLIEYLLKKTSNIDIYPFLYPVDFKNRNNQIYLIVFQILERILALQLKFLN